MKDSKRKMTFSKMAKNNVALFTLADLDVSSSSRYCDLSKPNEKREWNSLLKLIVFTPTHQSHLGDKFEAYKKLNSSSSNEFLLKVFSGLGITEENVFLFNGYTTKDTKKKDIKNDIVKSTDAMIALRCDNGVHKSLYAAIRNAIAHGNIIYEKGYYILYSVRDDKNEYYSELTFFLRIKRLSSLKALFKVIETYR